MVLSKNKPSRIESFVGWQIRHYIDIIVNTYGSVIQPTGKAAGGGILWNPNEIPLRLLLQTTRFVRLPVRSSVPLCTVFRLHENKAIKS
ncbi:hypothetical protein LINGRAHAP2_LOCUS34576 [Linum grandiflorum]